MANHISEKLRSRNYLQTMRKGYFEQIYFAQADCHFYDGKKWKKEA